MSAALLTIHLVLAIVLIGPLTAAASLFPRYAQQAVDAAEDSTGPVWVLRALHRISLGYAVAGITVPAFGISTGSAMGVLGDHWIWASIAVTALAGVLYAAAVVPVQIRIMGLLDDVGGVGSVPPLLLRLRVATGLFALLWVIVVILMIVRPGSSTGV